MSYQKRALTAVIYPKLSHAGLCLLTLLLCCVTPSSPGSPATGANSFFAHADEYPSLRPVATQGHSLRIRSSKILPADTHDRGTDDAALPAHATQMAINCTGGRGLPLWTAPRVDGLTGRLPRSRAPPAT